jgi:predicted nucleic acid-binding OB-fold protein
MAVVVGVDLFTIVDVVASVDVVIDLEEDVIVDVEDVEQDANIMTTTNNKLKISKITLFFN